MSWELHGQAELKRQLRLPGRAPASQVSDPLQGQAATQELIQDRAAQAQASMLLGEALPLLEQLQRCREQGSACFRPGPGPPTACWGQHASGLARARPRPAGAWEPKAFKEVLAPDAAWLQDWPSPWAGC